MTTQSERYAELFASSADQIQIVDQIDTTKVYAVSLDEKLGSLKDSSKAQYMVLTPQDGDVAKVIRLHPQAALQLLAQKSSAQFRVEDRVEHKAEQEAATTAQPSNNAAGENNSKRALTIAFYKAKKAELEANGPIEKVKGRCPLRSAVIKFITEELGGSAALASTYYQNVVSGKWS